MRIATLQLNSKMERSLIYCLSLVFLTLACAPKPELYKKSLSEEEKASYSKLFLKGIGRYYQGSGPERHLLAEALKLDPDESYIWREIGVPFLKRGFANGFHHFYAEAMRCDPVEWAGWRGYLYLYFYRDYERALADFHATDTLTPDFIDYPQSHSVLYMSGVCYFQLSQYEQALDYFQQHLTHEREHVGTDFMNPISFIFTYHTYLKLERREEALKVLEEGLSIHQNNADLWFWRAQEHQKSGQYSQSASCMKKAKELFEQEFYNNRPYVEEFFQLYVEDFDA